MPPLSRRDFARTAALTGLAGALPRAAAEAAASLPRDAPPGLVQLNSNENPFGPSPAALAALADAQGSASRYPDAAEERLADAIAARHGLAASQVVLGCGSSEILRMAAGAFTGPGRPLVACDTTFEAVVHYARVEAAETVRVPQTADFRHDLAGMAAACAGGAGLVYVCNPNNPTGTLLTRDEMDAFLARVPQQATVLVDEAYHEFVEDARHESAVARIGALPRVVVARTFSKIHGMAGLRLGYAVAAPERAEEMRAQATWNGANALALAAAAVSLADEAHLEGQRRRNGQTRRWLEAELRRDGRRVIPSHTNFLMIHLGTDVGPAIQAFRARGILVGRRFPTMPEWLRVSIGTPDETRSFLSALRAIVPAAAAA